MLWKGLSLKYKVFTAAWQIVISRIRSIQQKSVDMDQKYNPEKFDRFIEIDNV